MKKILCLAMALALVLSLAACGGKPAASSAAPAGSGSAAPASSAAPVKTAQYRIGTASTTGAFYPIGGMMASVLSDEIEGCNFTAEANGGALENCRLINQREIALGFSGSPVVSFAYHGEEDFAAEGPQSILSMGNLYVTPIQIISLKKKNITDIRQLEGQRITIGVAGSTPNSTSRILLKCFGLEDGVNCTLIPLAPGEACEGMKDGTVDVAIVCVGAPVSSITELLMTEEINMIEFSDEDVKTINAACPFIDRYVLAGGTYESIAEDKRIIGTGNELIINPDLPEDLVYQMAQVMFEKRFEDVKSSNNAMKVVTLENLPKTCIPLHPGAEKWYKEKGVL